MAPTLPQRETETPMPLSYSSGAPRARAVSPGRWTVAICFALLGVPFFFRFLRALQLAMGADNPIDRTQDTREWMLCLGICLFALYPLARCVFATLNARSS